MIWIGTYKGLAVLNPQTDNFINYKKQNNLLPGYVVYSLLESSNGEIWAGTSEGLVCLNKDRLTPVLFTTADGLPSDIICGLAEDEKKKYMDQYPSGNLQTESSGKEVYQLLCRRRSARK